LHECFYYFLEFDGVFIFYGEWVKREWGYLRDTLEILTNLYQEKHLQGVRLGWFGLAIYQSLGFAGLD